MYPRHITEDHIKKSEHDCSLAQSLSEGQDFYDWTIICAFHFALHRIEAYAHKTGKESQLQPNVGDRESIHRKRERFVKQYLSEYFAIYERLFEKSRQSRYDPTYYEKIRNLRDYHKRLFQEAMKLKNIPL